MPPYYAQQMASDYHQPLLVKSCVENETNLLDVTATRSREGDQLVLHIANTGENSILVNLDVSGFGKITKAKAITLSGKLTDVNLPEEPERIRPEEQMIRNIAKQVYEIEPHSYTILVFSR